MDPPFVIVTVPFQCAIGHPARTVAFAPISPDGRILIDKAVPQGMTRCAECEEIESAKYRKQRRAKNAFKRGLRIAP